MKKTYMFLFVVMLLGILAVSSVSALSVTITDVWVDNVPLDPTSSNELEVMEKNQELNVKVRIKADSNLTHELEDLQIEAMIRGYDHKDIIGDITSAFDLSPGARRTERLDITLPIRLDPGIYKLRIFVFDADDSDVSETYEFEIVGDNHAIWIKDVIFSPADTVMAGRALLTTVRIKNVGNEDEDDGIRVTVAIPELGLSAADYLDELDEDESATSEELYMRIPACAREGEYTVLIAATFNEGDDTETVAKKIYIVKGESCEADAPSVTPTTVISVGATQQGVVAGGADVIYPLTITNQEGTAKTYTFSVDSGDWATFRINPSNLILLNKGETATVYVYVTADEDAPVGDNLFVVNVKKGSELIKQITLKATVKEQTSDSDNTGTTGWNTVKKGLEVAVIVLVVLLVIIGLVIGFRKLKDDEDGEDKGESYY